MIQFLSIESGQLFKMTLQCYQCQNTIPPKSAIHCCFDKQFCSELCATRIIKTINEVDPNYTNPYIWKEALVNDKPSMFISIIISLFHYF